MMTSVLCLMRRGARLVAWVWLATLLTLTCGAATAQDLLGRNQVVSDQVSAALLVHAPQGVAAGQPLWAGLHLRHAPDWHTYWKNPGDSGLPTELTWHLPPGVHAGEIIWPTPKKFPLGPLANHGYDGTVLLAVPLTVDPGFSAAQLTVGLSASWLACRAECIPEDAELSLTVPTRTPTALHGMAFEAARQAEPKNAAAKSSQLSVEGQFLSVFWRDAPTTWQGKRLELFPETTAITEPGAPWEQSWNGATWSARIPLSSMRTEAPARLAVVLAQPEGVAHGQPMPAGIRLDLAVEGRWPEVQALGSPGVSPALEAALKDNAQRAGAEALALHATAGNGWSMAVVYALLGALLGGMVLNLMPCVFPVLAIKVLAFAQHADDHSAHRRAGLAYTAGVVLSFVGLGALLLALRLGGEQLGWGFQLQSPAVVAGLAALFTLLGLNLVGLFEFGSLLPSSVASVQIKNPTADAFLTGVLATAVASPCTAPFMGASLGLAIALPLTQALAVFATLGLGMALPYLLASWVPAVARALPRPGAWMVTFRQLMAFPMFATVVWLLWVLGQQSGIDGVATLLLLLVVMALGVWALGLQGRSRLVLTGVALASGLWLLTQWGPAIVRLPDASQAASGSSTVHPQASAVATGWQPWSPQRQAELLAQGRPVFVDFTAAWCVTCQYNKRTTLADADVLADVAKKQVALLRADWTRRDPSVTAALAELGRNGVPVYALHAPGQPTVVLSEVLSVSEVRAALAAL